MMHVSLYRDILVSAEAFDAETRDPRVHINVHDGESKRLTPDRLAYLDISPAQARRLAEELLAAAACCGPLPSAKELIDAATRETEQRKTEVDNLVRFALGLAIKGRNDETGQDA